MLHPLPVTCSDIKCRHIIQRSTYTDKPTQCQKLQLIRHARLHERGGTDVIRKDAVDAEKEGEE